MILASKYYVLHWGTDRIVGPMTFKDAVAMQEMAHAPCEILKLVVDVTGKEVK